MEQSADSTISALFEARANVLAILNAMQQQGVFRRGGGVGGGGGCLHQH